MAPAAFEPSTPSGRAGLAALLASPAEAVVALDFDGTLAPIVADPDQARAHPGAVPVLARLAPLVRAVVVVTGRPAQDAVRLGGFARVPGLEHLVVLGHYGAERWDAATGELRATQVHPGVAAIRAELPALLRRLSAPEGTWIEDKGRSLAVHTRRAADPEAALDAAARAAGASSPAAHGLVVEPGRMVLELRPPGTDKGVALTAPARAGGRSAVSTPATTSATSPRSRRCARCARRASRLWLQRSGAASRRCPSVAGRGPRRRRAGRGRRAAGEPLTGSAERVQLVEEPLLRRQRGRGRGEPLGAVGALAVPASTARGRARPRCPTRRTGSSAARRRRAGPPRPPRGRAPARTRRRTAPGSPWRPGSCRPGSG